MFAIAETQKQSKLPLTRDWMKRLWDIYTLKCESAIKDGDRLPFVTIWMNPESIVLSKISQAERTRTVWLHSQVGYKTESKKWANKTNELTGTGGSPAVTGAEWHGERMKRVKGWNMRWQRRLDFGRWAPNATYKWCVIKLCAWNLDNVISHVTPITLILKPQGSLPWGVCRSGNWSGLAGWLAQGPSGGCNQEVSRGLTGAGHLSPASSEQISALCWP